MGAAVAVAFLAGCGGGGGGALTTPPTTPQKPAGTPESVSISVIIGGTTAGRGSSSGVRRPKFVSPSTNGIDFKVYAHGGNTIIGQSDTDISSGSAACGSQTGTPRTCTINVPAPAGNDDFVATTYDGAPVSGSFASSHVLGIGTLNATIVSGQANNLTMYISGVINTLGFLAAHASLPADGVAHTLGFVLNPSDFDNNPITAGANDPYQNPISVQLNETGGSGHATIVKNGTNTSGTSTTLNFSTDTVAVRYDGGGAPGYDVAVTVSSTNVTAETLTISPMYVTSASPYRSGTTLTFTGTGQTALVNLSETGAAGTLQYHATASNTCSGIATASNPAVGPSSSSTVTATGAGSCTIAFGDGMSTITWNVVVSTTSATVTVPTGELGPIVFNGYANGPIQGQTDPASGKPWLSNSCGGFDYDAAVVNTGSYPANWTGFVQPTKALRFSNPVTQGCYSGLGTPEGPKTSGYPNALTDTSGPTQCGPTCNPYFSFQFTATSSTGGFQPDLEVNFSPVFANNGARMAWVGLWHTTDPSNNQKLLIFTNDVQGVAGGFTAPCLSCANFQAHEVAYVDPSKPHKIGLAMNFVQPTNDAVTIYVDGVQQPASTTVRSWEDYYLYDTESDPGFAYPYSRAVDDVLFRAGDVDTCLNFADYNDPSLTSCSAASPRTGHPGHTANSGQGFLITDISTCSGTQASCAQAISTSSFARSAQSRSTSFSRSSAANALRKMSRVR
ncbi:MAG: hypothetical protein M3169_04800 [Candidatus Eremiobacteraeota bacterium]|nr:hypothetical protein [Candidatus Eremiobacteraeota bacterium]